MVLAKHQLIDSIREDPTGLKLMEDISRLSFPQRLTLLGIRKPNQFKIYDLGMDAAVELYGANVRYTLLDCNN